MAAEAAYPVRGEISMRRTGWHVGSFEARNETMKTSQSARSKVDEALMIEAIEHEMRWLDALQQ
jgi:hypothetical protein